MSDDTPPRDDRLFTLASWIDEGREVDWDEATRAARDEDERAVVEELRLLAGVARVCRDPDSAIPASLRDPLDSDSESSSAAGDGVTANGVSATPASAPALGPGAAITWGGLTLIEPIGRGSFATVYRARDNLQREVALKLFAPARRADDAPVRARASDADALSNPSTPPRTPVPPDRVTRTRHEGELLARVKHPNIVTIHGADEHDGRPGLWMEFIHGRTLEAELATRGTFSPQEAALLGRDLCRALAAVHGARLLHRDVKAHNVMREIGGRIVLMDFGSGIDIVTRPPGAPRDVAGTPLYLAPELFAGAQATPASDIYSLGVLLFHLVTGLYPVDGANRSEIEAAHAQHRRRRLRDARPDLPDAFVQVIERALAPPSAQRFQTAGELDDALARACGLPTHLPTPSSSAGASIEDPERSIVIRNAATRDAVGGRGATGESADDVSAAPPSPRRPDTERRDAAPRAAWWPLTPAWGLTLVALLIAGTAGGWFARRSANARADGTPAVSAGASGAVRGAPSSTGTAANASATAPPASAPGSGPLPLGAYVVKATLYRQTGDEKIDLTQGDRIAPGDDIGLRFSSTQPLYTYIVNRDEHGEAYLLFPLKGHEQENPLPPGDHELPGVHDGREQRWEVTSRGGEEHFLLFADTSPMPEFDEVLRGLPTPEPGKPVRYAALPRALVGPVRGVGGVTPAPVGRSRRMNELFAHARPLGREPETVTGPWLRSITLKNPVE